LFIAHNLAVVEHFADEVAVMYLGKIVEKGPPGSLYANPTHPYTQALLSAIPVPDPTSASERLRLPGEAPSPVSPPSGCPFHPRCLYTREAARYFDKREVAMMKAGAGSVEVIGRCMNEVPALKPLADTPGHCHACLLK
jgi:oligopeptide/dipeptide ABC transporter ATP-binding protein